jgi:hypothetical protein
VYRTGVALLATQTTWAVRMPSCLSMTILLAVTSIALRRQQSLLGHLIVPPIWKGLNLNIHQDSLDCHGQLNRSACLHGECADDFVVRPSELGWPYDMCTQILTHEDWETVAPELRASYLTSNSHFTWVKRRCRRWSSRRMCIWGQ